MAEEVLEVSQRPEIVKMANDIIRTQNVEIAKFKIKAGSVHVVDKIEEGSTSEIKFRAKIIKKWKKPIEKEN